MTDRPKNHFRRLLPYGLIWGLFTGGVVHLWSHGFTLGPGTAAYLGTLVAIWGGAGILWAYLTAKFSRRKTIHEKEVS